jgi:hypothetical protein
MGEEAVAAAVPATPAAGSGCGQAVAAERAHWNAAASASVHSQAAPRTPLESP